MVFLLWNLVKQCKLALKKSHNLPHNSPILSHNLPWKYRTISDFLSHSIRWPALWIKLNKNKVRKILVCQKKIPQELRFWPYLILQVYVLHVFWSRHTVFPCVKCLPCRRCYLKFTFSLLSLSFFIDLQEMLVRKNGEIN